MYFAAGNAGDPRAAYSQTTALYAFAQRVLASDCQRAHQLILFYSFIAIVMVIFGSLMYLIEGPEYGFTTLNASVYWAIVTITTVGYGDITPHTPLGRIPGLHSYPDRLLHYCHTDRTYHHAYDQRPESSTTAAPVSAVSAGRP